MHRTDFHAIIASMKNLIFDYDGTLHETMRIYGPAFRKNYENLVSRGLAPAREFSDAEISGWLGFTAVWLAVVAGLILFIELWKRLWGLVQKRLCA